MSEKTTYYDDNGRICTMCGNYKERKEFHRKSGRCKECRKMLGRMRTPEERHQEYLRHKLKIGERIMYKGSYYEVVKYEYQKGYLLKSVLDGTYARVSVQKYFSKNKRA